MAPVDGKTPAVTIRVRTSRRAAEMLRLEIRRLAARLGLPPAAVRIRRIAGGRR
jgi:hypothetical protein